MCAYGEILGDAILNVRLLGSVAALAASRLIAASLYEVAPADPLTFVGVALLLGAVAVAAALVPTRRATRINPVEVLSG